MATHKRNGSSTRSGADPYSPANIRRALFLLPPNNRPAAKERLGWLEAFWKLDLERGGKNRCQTRREVAARFGVSRSAIEQAELNFRQRGVVGLAGVHATGVARVSQDVLDLARGATPDALRQIARLLTKLARRMEAAAARAPGKGRGGR